MTFETEYALQEFRKIQKEHFDSEGKIYAGNGQEHSLAEQMLNLINQLEQEIKKAVSISILQEIYDSEINFKIESVCWDGGITVAIKPSNPYDGSPWGAEETVYGIETAINTLICMIKEHYPNSVFISKCAVEFLEGK